ncbi:MAG: hypothetical protein HQL28_03965 [Candidatus Omnitrophica bacterium]|nr:hypothetical protein [Candidatus Omnitrophota bacterium]
MPTKKKDESKSKKILGLSPLLAAFAALFLIIGLMFALGHFFFAKPKSANGLYFQKGIVYGSWSRDGYLAQGADQSLEALKATGANSVGVLVTWYQDTCWSNEIKRLDITPSDEAVIKTIRKAHELGMKVMLKPHLDIVDTSDGSWRGEIGCVKDADWSKWFEGYTNYIMYYVDIAIKEKVEMICIGTELSNIDASKPEFWDGLIAKIRAKYSGSLTYAAHWDRYIDIRFWDKLDYVGINAYFPLSSEMRPTYDQLKEGWSKWVTEMEEFQKQVKKPIIFPEIGCNSADGAAIRPWEHNPRREVNLALQADYYKALMDIFFQKEWFYGQYWWIWGTNKNMGGPYNRAFTPQNKPAAKIVTEYYAKNIKR